MNPPRPIISSQSYVGIQYGYIIIPSDVDRDAFIQQCYRWERVSIMLECGGGVFHDCYITRTALQQIEFPLTSKQLGSCVILFTDINSGHPIVLEVLSKEDESQLLREGFFKIIKTNNGGIVSISGDAKTGVLNLSVNGGTLSQLNILVSNADKNATINVQCRGDINIELDGTLQITDDKFKINGGTQSMVKGNELKTQLDDTNTYLNNLYTALYTAFQALDAVVPGISTTFQAAMAGKLPGDYTNINSDESFLD